MSEKKKPTDTAGVLNSIRGRLISKRLPDEIPADLVKALREGDASAFERIYKDYMPSVLNFLHALFRSFETAEELTQEVSITLWEKRGEIDPAKSLRGYLYVMARNAARQ